MAPPSYAHSCNTTTAAWLALVCLAAQAAQATDQCDGPVVQILIKAQSLPAPSTVYGVLATFGGIPSFNITQPAGLTAAEPLSACTTIQNKVPGAYYVVERGSCSFVDKYTAVLAAGGAGMLLFDDQPGCINMGGAFPNSSSNSSSSPVPQPQPRNASLPPAISIDRKDGLSLVSLLQAAAAAGAADQVLLQLQLLEVPALDASALLLWIMAVGTVVAGSLWSGADYALELKGSAAGFESGRGSGSGQGSGSGHSSSGGGLEILEVTAAGAVGFVLFSSGVLVLLYFFLNKAFFYVILVGFSIAGAQALGIMLLPAARAALPGLACRKVNLPFGWGYVSGTEVAVTPVAVAVAVVWAVARNAAWSWVLQDLLGVAVMLLVLRTLRLPDMRVACVLLPLCFCYDVFWVFLQPMLTGGGTSVMVEVAGGGDSHEFLPMLLRVPRISGPPILKGAYSLLGFGDVILPGMLVALTRRLDIAGRTTWHGGYYVASVMGYGAGLLLTYVALMFSWFGDEGQPALLYLVPCTLGIVLLLAAARGELRALLAASEDGSAGSGGGGYGGYGYEAVGGARAGAELLVDDGDGIRGAGYAAGGVEDASVAIDGQGDGVQQGAGGMDKPAGLAAAAAAVGTAGAVGGRSGRAAAGRQQRPRGRGQGRLGRPDAFV